MSIDRSKAPEGATHWSPGNRGRFILEAYWRPDGEGTYDCWAITGNPYWKTTRARLPDYAVEIGPAWTGEGLPPVGVVCIVTPHNTLWGFLVVDDYECKVLAYHGDFAWLDCGGTQFITTRTDKVDFRPIRTPEQIAAEECDKAVQAMLGEFEHAGSLTSHYEVCEVLHKAGYRKQVAP